MKALTLYQPWASLLAVGVKVNETRPRPWSHVGDFAVHAGALRWRSDVPDYAMEALQVIWNRRDLFPGRHRDVRDLYMSLPFGAVVGVVRKTGCHRTEDPIPFTPDIRRELELGDYSPGRFWYPTENPRLLARPVRCRGFQGPFDLDPEVEAAVRAQI